MKIKYFIVSILVLLVMSCINNDGQLNDSEVKKHKDEILKNGSKYSYNKLYLHYSNRHDYQEILSFSIIMAYKYNDSDAYFQIYEGLIRSSNSNKFDYSLLKNLNEDSSKFAINCLEKSAKLNNLGAKNFLLKHLTSGIGMITNKKKIDSLNVEIAKVK